MYTRRHILAGVMASAAGTVSVLGRAVSTASAAPGVKRTGGRIPNVPLRTHEGQTVRLYDDLIQDKSVVINFIYTSCGDTCPMTTANLLQVQRLLSAQMERTLFMYSITLDPAHDTPAVLKTYATAFQVQPGWLFLTGERTHIEQVRRRLGFVDADPVVDADKSQHLSMLIIGHDPLDRWKACQALSSPEQIARTITWVQGTG